MEKNDLSYLNELELTLDQAATAVGCGTETIKRAYVDGAIAHLMHNIGAGSRLRLRIRADKVADLKAIMSERSTRINSIKNNNSKVIFNKLDAVARCVSFIADEFIDDPKKTIAIRAMLQAGGFDLSVIDSEPMESELVGAGDR